MLPNKIRKLQAQGIRSFPTESGKCPFANHYNKVPSDTYLSLSQIPAKQSQLLTSIPIAINNLCILRESGADPDDAAAYRYALFCLGRVDFLHFVVLNSNGIGL